MKWNEIETIHVSEWICKNRKYGFRRRGPLFKIAHAQNEYSCDTFDYKLILAPIDIIPTSAKFPILLKMLKFHECAS